jgi:hypothetical protein
LNLEFYTNVLEKMLCKQSHPGSWTRQKKMTDRINYMNSTKNRVRDTNEIKKKKTITLKSLLLAAEIYL